jgi:hypothetical protein
MMVSTSKAFFLSRAIKVETDCGTCKSNAICSKDMRLKCRNYLFGTTCGTVGTCERCIHFFLRKERPCFLCEAWESSAREDK